ncbi:hypothetical protein, partial [Pseudonocardia benzenivorans]|uniref:hypothetical protein n=1 Tax=Pseudonocardia benzenivorans TaxID=228005 RepID=UPI0036D34579
MELGRAPAASVRMVLPFGGVGAPCDAAAAAGPGRVPPPSADRVGASVAHAAAARTAAEDGVAVRPGRAVAS